MDISSLLNYVFGTVITGLLINHFSPRFSLWLRQRYSYFSERRKRREKDEYLAAVQIVLGVTDKTVFFLDKYTSSTHYLIYGVCFLMSFVVQFIFLVLDFKLNAQPVTTSVFGVLFTLYAAGSAIYYSLKSYFTRLRCARIADTLLHFEERTAFMKREAPELFSQKNPSADGQADVSKS